MEKTREAFHLWCNKNGMDAGRYWERGGYHYAKRETELAWRAFKAGAESKGRNHG